MSKTYEILSYANLKKLNHQAKWKNKNHFIPEHETEPNLWRLTMSYWMGAKLSLKCST